MKKKKWNLEIKCFNIKNGPSFDLHAISKFLGLKGQSDWLSKAMYKTDYLFFGYEINSEGKRYQSQSTTKNSTNYSDTEVNIRFQFQYSSSQYKNIRPSCLSTWNDKTKTPEKFIKHFKRFIGKLPTNLIGNKTELRQRIQKLFDELKKELTDK